mgnify:CR=1 FL=1
MLISKAILAKKSQIVRPHAEKEDADTVLTVEEASTGKGVPLAVDPALGTISGIQFSDDESHAVITVSSDRSPRNLVAHDLASGKATPLTRTLNPEIDAEDLVESKIVRFEASEKVTHVILQHNKKSL